MIAVTCGECRHEFEAPDIKVGMEVLCPPCGIRVRVPRPGEARRSAELVGVQAAEGTQRVDGDVAPAPARIGGDDRRHWSPDRAPDTAVDREESETETWDDGTRTFPPRIEDDERSRHLIRIGQALSIAFVLPLVGAPGHALWFPQFTAFPGINPAGLLMLLPLFAGLTLIAIARRIDPLLRGVIAIAAGLAMFGVIMIDRGARSMIGDSMSALPTSVSLSSLLLLLGLGGLVVSTRVRWYRPTKRNAYVIGAAAAGCYLLYLFIPVNGGMPIGVPFQIFKVSVLMGLGVIAHIGLIAAAAVLCAINLPATLASDASTKAGRAFLCLIGGVAIPILVITLAFMFSGGPSISMPGMNMGSPSIFFLSAAVKFGVMYGGLALLIPIGIADLLIGRAEPD